MRLIYRFLKDQGGATSIEYGLLAGLISIAIILAVRGVGTRLTTRFQAVSGNLT